MTSWAIGLSTGCFYHQNILDCLPLIRESGFSMIEVCSTPEHLNFHDLKLVHRAAERIRELGMEAYSFHAPFAPNIDIASCDSGQRADSVAEIFKAAEAASLLRIHYFVLHPGSGKSCRNTSGRTIAANAGRHRFAQSSSKTLQRARHHVRAREQIAAPTLWKHKRHSWILDGINTAEIGACLDTGHAFLAGDMHGLVHKLSGHLRMIHAHDNGGVDDNHLPPGDGRIDWEKFLRDLIQVRFRGAFILEMAGNDDPAVTMTNARRGRSYLRGIARSLALQPR